MNENNVSPCSCQRIVLDDALGLKDAGMKENPVKRLQDRVFSFCQTQLKMTENEMSSISFSANDLLQLKIMLSDINNVITYLLTRSFLQWLLEVELISCEQYDLMIKDIDNQNVNANGFDVNFQYKGMSIVAEVKANLPVCNNRFGAAQLSALTKDVRGLVYGKLKDADKGCHLSDAYKFMVLLNSDNVESACHHWVEYCKKKIPQVRLTTLEKNVPVRQLHKDEIYVVILNLDGDFFSSLTNRNNYTPNNQ